MQTNKTLIKAAFQAIFTNPVYNEDILRQYFSNDYIQHVDGHTLDFEGFCRHIQLQKTVMPVFDIHFESMAAEDHIVFTNHLVSGTDKQGKTSKAHVLAEFHVRHGKINYCSELTRLISGDEAHGNLGSIH